MAPASRAPRLERRRHQRVPLLGERLWCDGSRGTQLVFVLDAAEEGVFVLTARLLAPGETVWLSGQDGGLAGLEAEAEVVWVRASEPRERVPGMGLHIRRFLRGEEQFRALLQRQRRIHGLLLVPGGRRVAAHSSGASGWLRHSGAPSAGQEDT